MSTPTIAKVRKIVAGSLAAAAVAVPISIATTAPAEATTYRGGCWVTPQRPTAQRVLVLRNGVFRYDTRITYSTRVTCVNDRIIRVADYRYESDAPAGLAGDDYQGYAVYNKTFAAGGSVTFSSSRWLSTLNTEIGSEELYHRVTFKVASINGVSGWTPWENSPVLVA